MVFENVTLFEIKLENDPFASRSTTRSGDGAAGGEAESAESAAGGGRRRIGGVVLASLLIVGFVLWRRSGSDETDFEIDEEPAEADLADAQ